MGRVLLLVPLALLAASGFVQYQRREMDTNKKLLPSGLQYFSRDEFQGDFEDLSPELLGRLDAFRAEWGRPVSISTAPGAILRVGSGTSQHFAGRAVDIFPQGMTTRQDAERARRIAINVGFTGIGVYPLWRPSAGLHLDVRPDPGPRGWDEWGGWPSRTQAGEQTYGSVDQALTLFS
jgi:uncharacterized protein YcbK (DUF882 family)